MIHCMNDRPAILWQKEVVMNKTGVYHVCLSSHDEVMFRSAADLNMGFNCLAVAALFTGSQLLAEGFMTTHYHFLLRTSSLREVMFRCRYAYARYFNIKYHRSGSIGEKRYFWLEIDGLYHTLSAQLCYKARPSSRAGNNSFRLSALFGECLLPFRSREN